MSTGRLVHRLLAVAICAGALLFARPASSKPRPQPSAASRICAYAYHAAIKAEKGARLLDARRLFSSCAASSCSPVVQKECAARHGRLEDDIPSVIPLVTDGTDTPVVDVDVTMDGQPLVSRLDGRAVSVDPGLHEFVFVRDDVVLATRKVVVAQGQRNHTVAVALPPAKVEVSAPPLALAAPPVREIDAMKPVQIVRVPQIAAPPKASSSVAPYLLTVVGLAGLGGYPLLTYWGRKDNERLAGCSPNCSVASTKHIRQLYIGADASLGIGVAALMAATWIAIGSGPNREETTRRSRYAFDLNPSAAGAVASMSGAF